MMHLADQAKPEELRLKGAPGGKTYIGPEGDPPGSQQDREVLSFDGRILILRWLDPEVQGRYGTMVYVRCGPEGAKHPAKPKAKPNQSPSRKPRRKPFSHRSRTRRRLRPRGEVLCTSPCVRGEGVRRRQGERFDSYR